MPRPLKPLYINYFYTERLCYLSTFNAITIIYNTVTAATEGGGTGRGDPNYNTEFLLGYPFNLVFGVFACITTRHIPASLSSHLRLLHQASPVVPSWLPVLHSAVEPIPFPVPAFSKTNL